MNIAAITITYNDDYKIKEWIDHYQFYKDEIYLHIVIDNSSNCNYLKQVETAFPDSVLIKRQTNGGCTIAYNDGIRYALANKNIDAIMLIGNDVRMEKGGVAKLYSFLMGNRAYGMVAPIMFSKDSDTIEDFGSTITPFMIMNPIGYKKKLEDFIFINHEVPAVMGGMNLAKRDFYEQIGLQDENLFMYSDEVDMGLRARNAGIKLAVTSGVKSWHQHINPPGNSIRLPFTSYLIGRNKVYLAQKHYGLFRGLVQFIFHLFLFCRGFIPHIFNKTIRLDRYYFLWGSYCGLRNKMNLKHIIKDS